ncbi:MAG: hypothetical protein ABIO55_11980 [Ginsengibacter sp.]
MNFFKIVFFTLITLVFISCKKEYSYENGNNISGGTWQFQNKATQYSGNVDSSFIETMSGTKVLTIEGKSLSGQEKFRIRLYTADSFTATTYLASLSQGDFDFFTSTKTIFNGDVLAGEFTVNIIALSNNTITGTFSGVAVDSTGAQTQIVAGTFTSAIDLSDNTGSGVTISAGSLGSIADSCTPIILSGVYKEGRTFTAANTLQVKVNVTTPGSFIITTNSVNGISFFKSGNFTATGVQDVILNGSGTPQNEGVETFIVTYGTSNCTFLITFDPPDPPATGTLGGAGGTCTPITSAGIYTQGIPLDASNTISIQVNVAAIGSYDISTNTVNGVIFSSSGSFTTTGAQTVILKGAGTPISSGTQNFAVTFDAGTCNFSITFDAPPSPALGTLGGAGGTCTPVTPAGTYTQGVPVGAGNTITIQVNVTSVGPYEITTNIVNGISFTDAGDFTTTGIKSVVLTASGIPVNSGLQTFTVSFGTSTCNFPITFAAGVLAIYSCKIDGLLTTFTDEAHAEVIDGTSGQPDLYLDGYTSNASNAAEFQIFIDKNDATAITPGKYDEKSFIVFPGGYRIEVDYTVENPDLSVTIWNTSSNFLPPPNPAFTITVTSISATRVKGTFSGTLTNPFEGSTAFKVITEGVFDLPIQ